MDLEERKHTRLFGYRLTLDKSKRIFKDSIALPSQVSEIVGICAYVDNGTEHGCYGFLSLYNEKSNEQIINTLRIANDKGHFNDKLVYVANFPNKNNLNYVFEIGHVVDKLQPLSLHVLIQYKEAI